MSIANDPELREFSAADADALLPLRNQFQAADDSLEVWRQRDSSPDQRQQVFQTAWLEGQIVGFVRLVESTADVLNLSLAVRGESRGQGIGSRLWEYLWVHAQPFTAVRWQTSLRDPSVTALYFLERRGFAVRERSVYSRLSLPAAPNLELTLRLERQGYRFCTLRAAGDTPVNRDKLYWLVREAVIDDPSFEGEFETLEQFGQMANADAFKRGYSEIRTNNDSRNAGMLAVNGKTWLSASLRVDLVRASR